MHAGGPPSRRHRRLCSRPCHCKGRRDVGGGGSFASRKNRQFRRALGRQPGSAATRTQDRRTRWNDHQRPTLRRTCSTLSVGASDHLQKGYHYMNAIRVLEKAANIDALTLSVVTANRTSAGPGQCVSEVLSAGVNPSDVKAALGAMPHADWPRTPGRGYAGVVVDG